MMKNKLYPCLWFDGKAREAADLYREVFGNAKIMDENPVVVTMEMHGQKFMLLNGGPMYRPNPSISFMVLCETKEEVDKAWEKLVEGGMAMMAMDSTYDHAFKFSEGISIAVDCDMQKEIDHYWDKLTADGGEESMCGWLKDKFGVSWQIVPAILPKLMADPEKGQKVVDAFLKMKKFDIKTLLSV